MTENQTKQSERIRLFIDGNGWMMQTDSQETIDLFGTNTLPLPFLRATRAHVVLRTIMTLNPNATVVLREDYAPAQS